MGDDQIKDKRFAHVQWDPKFRQMPTKERKVTIDSRFSAMFTDAKFQTDYTVDKRGRPFRRTTGENLREFYQLESDDDGEASSGQEDEVNDSQVACSSASLAAADGDIVLDLARGLGNVSTSESGGDDEDWELESDGADETQTDWTQLDAEAPRTETATRRLALCNMDWDRILAKDLFMVFNSFKPVDGAVNSVKIYPSEFGRQRMVEEEAAGPLELRDDQDDPEQNYVSKGSRQWWRHVSRIRQYEVSRLRYYYAVVDCDSPETADAIYTACDGMEYLASTIKMDLRFIPDSVTFDESLVKAMATAADAEQPYKPTSFHANTLSQTAVKLTWDDDDFHRKQKVQRAFDSQLLKANAEGEFRDLLASASSEEDDEREDEVLADDDGDEDQCSVATSRREGRIEVYRELLKDLERKEEVRRRKTDETPDGAADDDLDLEVTFEPALQSTADQVTKRSKNQRDKEAAATTPWQQYLQRRKEKRRLKKQQSRLERERIRFDVDSEDDARDDEERVAESSAADAKEIGQLELLTAEDDGRGREHYNLKRLIKEARLKPSDAPSSSGDQFELNLQDRRFDAIYSSHLFSIDPSSSHYKRTKGMQALLDEKRRRITRRERIE